MLCHLICDEFFVIDEQMSLRFFTDCVKFTRWLYCLLLLCWKSTKTYLSDLERAWIISLSSYWILKKEFWGAVIEDSYSRLNTDRFTRQIRVFFRGFSVMHVLNTSVAVTLLIFSESDMCTDCCFQIFSDLSQNSSSLYNLWFSQVFSLQTCYSSLITLLSFSDNIFVVQLSLCEFCRLFQS